MKALRYLFIIVSVTLIVVSIGVSAFAQSSPVPTAKPVPPTPAPSPTPGPAPTDAPYALEMVIPITDRQIAIQLALKIDNTHAVRDQPLTQEMIAANPDMITADRFKTQAETDFGVVTAIANEPVWVVTIRAKGTFSLPCMACRGPIEADSVSYELLEQTGQMMGISVHPLNR